MRKKQLDHFSSEWLEFRNKQIEKKENNFLSLPRCQRALKAFADHPMTIDELIAWDAARSYRNRRLAYTPLLMALDDLVIRGYLKHDRHSQVYTRTSKQLPANNTTGK